MGVNCGHDRDKVICTTGEVKLNGRLGGGGPTEGRVQECPRLLIPKRGMRVSMGRMPFGYLENTMLESGGRLCR